MMTQLSGDKVELHTPEFELRSRAQGPYLVLVAEGRYTPELLGHLKERFLDRPRHLAFDLNGLLGVSLPLVRVLIEYAQGIPQGQGRVFLIRPPEKIRSLERLIVGHEAIPFVMTAEDLEHDPDAGREQFLEDLQYVRHEVETHPLWNLRDTDACWLCPFCARVRLDIRLVLTPSKNPVSLERIAFHLRKECPSFRRDKPEPWPEEVLRRLLDHVNADKAVQRESAKGTKRLQERASRAEKLESDMRIAGERHRRLLPPTPTILGCEIAVFYQPAEEIGGDWYDFVPMPGGCTAIVVGDVSGHGVEAGVLMGMAKKVLHIRLKEGRDLASALAQANDDLHEDLTDESFVTVVVAVLDPNARTITYARAGHPAGLLLRPGPEVDTLDTPGPVLGPLPGDAFAKALKTETRPVPDGCILLLYTDGLEDARGPEGDEFGPDRVAVTLASASDEDPGILLASLALTVDEHTGGRGPDDDVTVIAVRFGGPA